MQEKINYYQKKLKISAQLMEVYPTIEAQSHEEFLLKLLAELYDERTARIQERNLTQAQFPIIKSFDSYDWNRVELPEKLPKHELLSLDFIERNENLILYGPTGRGKTHLSIAIGLEAIKQHKKVLFFTVHDLVNKISYEKERGGLSRFMKKIDNAELLIIDEWGYLPLHQEGARYLFEIISKCYEKKSIILTTNIEFSLWKGFLFDEKLTAAIVDRLVHHSHMLFFKENSYRNEHSLMKN